jgi:hypothetical protein
MLKLTHREVLEAIAKIYGLLADGKKDDEIIVEMGISAEDYKALKAAMFDSKADEVRTRPIEHVYVDYILKQTENIKDLTAMISDWKNTKQYTAMVGAVRARSEIYDKMISVGQDCGIIHKQADRKEIMAGLIIADLTNKQLKQAITKELDGLNVLMKRYGDADIMAIDAGTLHHGEALKELPEPIPTTSTKPEKDKGKNKDHVDAPAIFSSALPTFKPKFSSEASAPRNTKNHAGRRVVKNEGGARG